MNGRARSRTGKPGSQPHRLPGTPLTNWKVPLAAMSRRHAESMSAREKAAQDASSKAAAQPRSAGSRGEGWRCLHVAGREPRTAVGAVPTGARDAGPLSGRGRPRRQGPRPHPLESGHAHFPAPGRSLSDHYWAAGRTPGAARAGGSAPAAALGTAQTLSRERHSPRPSCQVCGVGGPVPGRSRRARAGISS